MNFFRSQLLRCKIFIIAFAGSLLLRTINRTLRWKTVGLEGEKKFWPCSEPIILVFWHGHQLLMPWIYLNGRRKHKCREMFVLISQHRDGRFIAEAIRMLGINSISGSSSHRGREAIFDLIKTLKSGSHIAITPDGPKGPSRKVKSGIIRIAQRSGVPIYASAIASKNKWTFGSWDKMTLPKPFSKTILIMGNPISVPAELHEGDLDRYSMLVETELNRIAQQAEEIIANNG